MSNNVVYFDFKEDLVRVFMVDNEPWFVAKDVCDVLGYKLTTNATRMIPDSQKGIRLVNTLGGTQKMLCLAEAGLYRLVLRSDKKEAEPFIDWVTGEVLPSIRKTGYYLMGAKGDPNYLPFYHAFMDDVKKVANQAKANGSKTKQAVFHMNFNKMINKAFNLDAGMRNKLSGEQSVLVSGANMVAHKAVSEGLEQGMDHKQVYQYTKSRVNEYAGTMKGLIHTKPVISQTTP